ncbi:YfkD famly protein [Bacillus sp. Marseille-P3661]|uniref:YfkD famly protein n=1 Tax=Bacillus sp. Marseille-P3661 TaxID=1936234 RepID=UPI0021559FB8|nr:YfkD famly protein [Bacillus sp. Marseille-P3661]
MNAADAKGTKSNKIKVPDSVLDISKENTYPNPTQDLPYLQPSELTKTLLETTEVPIQNPDLIRILNESSINTTPTAIGYRATIYLGQWPLSYESTETNVNWEYKPANTNNFDNRSGKSAQKLHYQQEEEKVIKGGLTSRINNAEEVQKMMMLTAMKKTELPLAFETVIGQGTKKEQVYNVAPKKLGYLYAYTPAVNEKGKITFGEVYLELKGSKVKLKVKNVTQQGIGAWIPVQDHLSFKFVTSESPR